MVAALSVKRGIEPTTDEAAEDIELAAIFGPLAFHSASGEFRGGLLEAWYGAATLDLRDAKLAPEGATLRVRAIFAGAQIIVPADWKVVSRVGGMGGLTDMRETKGDAVDAPELVIEGTVFAGGIAVQSELDDDAAMWAGKMAERSGWSQRRKMGFGQGWKQDASDAADQASDAAQDVANDVTDTAKSAKNKVTDTAKSAKGTVTDAASSLTEAAADAADAAESEMAPAT
jgi:gas vesicle protein